MNLKANKLILEDVHRLLISAMMWDEEEDMEYAIGIIMERVDEAVDKIQRVLEDYSEV